jgi:hypothetical protein
MLLGGRMLRWILQDHDHISVFKHYAVSEAVVHAQLSQVGFDQPFWFYVTDQAFRTFFNRDFLRPEEMPAEQLKIWQSEMQRLSIPHEMKTQIRKLLLDEGLSTKKFSVRLSCDLLKGAMPNKFLHDYCEMSAYGAEGIFQAIKASWLSLLNKSFMVSLWNSGLSLADVKIGIIIITHSEIKEEGKVYSVSPKCLWDRRHLVLTLTKHQAAKDFIEARAEAGEHAYLVDRENLTVTYYGRNIFGEKTKSRTSAPFDYELIKKVAKQFIQAEKSVGHPLIGEWVTTKDGHSYFNRWCHYGEVPCSSFYQETLNSPARNFWYLMQWSPNGEICHPFWFSLMVKHFRSMVLRFISQTGAKAHMPANYEKVLRQSMGILRGRAYLNLGAFHRLLHLAPYGSLFTELDRALGTWQKRFDKELRVFWDGPWPDLPQIKESDRKKMKYNYKRIISTIKKNTDIFGLQFENEIQSLYDIKWESRNLTEAFQELREIEGRMAKIMMPLMATEFEYWSMKSYCHKVSANSGDFSWLEDEESEFVPIEGTWLERRRSKKLNEKWEQIKKSRKKVHQNIYKYFDLMKKRVELLAVKFVALGILKKASDIFFLTLDEILSYEEGRLLTINLQSLVEFRSEEYKAYAADEKIPQIWLTIGMVGLAEKYQSVISIKDLRQNWMPSVEDFIETEQPQNFTPIAEVSMEAAVFGKDAVNDSNTIEVASEELETELLELPSQQNFVENLIKSAAADYGETCDSLNADAAKADFAKAEASESIEPVIITDFATPVDQVRFATSIDDAKDEEIFKEVSLKSIEI